jgi:MFS family permease
VLEAAMAWQTYQISNSPLNLGLLGLVRFLPALALTVIGGAVADTYNRRNIVLAAQIVPLGCATMLAAASFGGWANLTLIYGLVMLLGFASAFEGPASQALLPGLVRTETFANAVTVSSVAQTIGFVSGPFAAGLLIDAGGEGLAYAVVAVLDASGMLLLPVLRYQQMARSGRFTFGLVGEGLRFVFGHQVLLAAMTLDMFAVIFGGAKALLPVYASDILNVGAAGYGVLGASFEAGAFIMSLFLVVFPPIQRTGRALIYVVVIFGVGTILFGLSTSFWLSCAVYFSIGAADQISVVMRKTTIQLATPDQLRGRVTAVGQVFIGASNQLGGLESGLVATLTNPVFAVVSGGVGTLITVGLVRWKMPALWAYRIPGPGEAPGGGNGQTAEPSKVAAPPASS